MPGSGARGALLGSAIRQQKALLMDLSAHYQAHAYRKILLTLWGSSSHVCTMNGRTYAPMQAKELRIW